MPSDPTPPDAPKGLLGGLLQRARSLLGQEPAADIAPAAPAPEPKPAADVPPTRRQSSASEGSTTAMPVARADSPFAGFAWDEDSAGDTADDHSQDPDPETHSTATVDGFFAEFGAVAAGSDAPEPAPAKSKAVEPPAPGPAKPAARDTTTTVTSDTVFSTFDWKDDDADR